MKLGFSCFGSNTNINLGKTVKLYLKISNAFKIL